MDNSVCLKCSVGRFLSKHMGPCLSRVLAHSRQPISLPTDLAIAKKPEFESLSFVGSALIRTQYPLKKNVVQLTGDTGADHKCENWLPYPLGNGRKEKTETARRGQL